MYKHEIKYRYKEGGGTSSVQTLEISLDERMYMSGNWKEKCKNLIMSKKGINPSDINDDSHFRIDYIGKDDESSNIESNSNNQSGKGIIAGGFFNKEAKKETIEHKSAEQVMAEHQADMEQREAVRNADKEFFASAKKHWKIWVPILAVVIGLFVFLNMKQNDTKENAGKINLQLEQIEDKIKLAIQDGDRNKALEFTNQLVHPTHEIWEGKGGVFKTVYFDEYWSKKRENYKEEIMKMGSSSSNENKEVKTEAVETKPEETSKADVQVNDEPTTEEIVYYKIQDPDGYSNLRKEPNGEVIKKVYDSEKFEVIGTEGKFKKVKLSDGTIGFINESRVVEIK